MVYLILMNKYTQYLYSKEYMSLLSTGIIILIISSFVHYFAGVYATEVASNSVADIILSNTRPLDVHLIFIYGPVAFWTYVAIICLRRPERIPFVIKNIALFTIIRSVFISLTHIGPFPTEIVVQSDMLKMFLFGGDLFFSGHTGLPFLMALVFWKNIKLRILFILSAILFGVVVLLGHLHYTIDVLSAFFITYTIFHIAKVLFPKDEELFYRGIRDRK